MKLIGKDELIETMKKSPVWTGLDAIARINAMPSIDLDDYVPREFHDKTCEAMAKRHQDEIADMVSVVRCKECASYCGDGNKCLWGLLTGDMGYCHHGYRGGDCIAEQTEPSLEQFRVGLEYHTDATHFGKLKGEGVTTNKTEPSTILITTWKCERSK